ncbi:4'-phosphopantetheinyl transferase EntD (siderophore biosynthesis) [Amycolatopsis xylanica]|uniref:4'-phosphopantetheinyl transferase EntD (Siderophore biosynthesis) n=1 Tax=Amycolatopsis xylanica TaxID=589385 RepID=A0A1H3NF73_9PSEU|nr:4'-phosphopantetheinyl transferase superfamily protein [Amycolatopsis xylanica]SDY87383.1 4'-phosphopantetheinyl transferase EntD (siderophore biosynthesis) [Amycolatopsis xylanica]
MLGKLLPSPVVWCESFDDPADVELFPEEAELIEKSVDKRRREFTTARWCARQAFAELGVPAAPVLPGLHGAPRWPASIVGSITHCAGYRAVALARTAEVAALGLDAEPNGPLPDGVLETIALPEERAWIRRSLLTDPLVRWDRLLFSMKESVYKTWYPLTGTRLEFEDALITADRSGEFAAHLLIPSSPVLRGNWLAADGLLVTAITLAA